MARIMDEFRFVETPERNQAYEDLERDLKAMEEDSDKPQIKEKYANTLKGYFKNDKSDIHEVAKRKLKELSTKKKKPRLETKEVHRSG